MIGRIVAVNVSSFQLEKLSFSPFYFFSRMLWVVGIKPMRLSYVFVQRKSGQHCEMVPIHGNRTEIS